jgi:hypothetical protein
MNIHKKKRTGKKDRTGYSSNKVLNHRKTETITEYEINCNKNKRK